MLYQCPLPLEIHNANHCTKALISPAAKRSIWASVFHLIPFDCGTPFHLMLINSPTEPTNTLWESLL